MNVFFDNEEENKKLLEKFGKKVSVVKDIRTGEETVLDDDISKLMAIRLALFNPEVILLWEQDIAYTQLDMYKFLIEGVDKRVAIICKSLKGKTEREIGLKNIPIFEFSKSNKFIDLLGFATNLKTILYISAKTNNFSYIKKWPNLNHVFAGHGDPDKHSSSDRHSFIYDFEMVADSNAISRFYKQGVEYPINRFIPIGGFVYDGVIAKNSDEKTTFQMGIYAPTWEGHSDVVNFSSVGKIKDQVLEYSKTNNIIFRPHPGLGGRLSDFKQSKTDLSKSLVKQSSKAKDFNSSDFIISDISGVMSEYLFTRKPIIVPVTAKDWTKEYVENSAVKDYAYLWEFDKITLSEYIKNIKDDPLKEKREKRANELYPGIYSIEDSIKRFQTALDFLSLDCIMKNLRQGNSIVLNKKCFLEQETKDSNEQKLIIETFTDLELLELSKKKFNELDFKGSNDYFDKIDKKYPFDRYACLLKGDVLNKINKPKEAIRWYYLAARKAPMDKNIVLKYVNFAKNYKKTSEILNDLQHFSNIKPDKNINYELEISKLQIIEKNHDIAFSSLNKLEEKFGKSAVINKIKGDLFFDIGDYPLAKENYLEALELDNSLLTILSDIWNLNYKLSFENKENLKRDNYKNDRLKLKQFRKEENHKEITNTLNNISFYRNSIYLSKYIIDILIKENNYQELLNILNLNSKIDKSSYIYTLNKIVNTSKKLDRYNLVVNDFFKILYLLIMMEKYILANELLEDFIKSNNLSTKDFLLTLREFYRLNIKSYFINNVSNNKLYIFINEYLNIFDLEEKIFLMMELKDCINLDDFLRFSSTYFKLMRDNKDIDKLSKFHSLLRLYFYAETKTFVLPFIEHSKQIEKHYRYAFTSEKDNWKDELLQKKVPLEFNKLLIIVSSLSIKGHIAHLEVLMHKVQLLKSLNIEPYILFTYENIINTPYGNVLTFSQEEQKIMKNIWYDMTQNNNSICFGCNEEFIRDFKKSLDFIDFVNPSIILSIGGKFGSDTVRLISYRNYPIAFEPMSTDNGADSFHDGYFNFSDIDLSHRSKTHGREKVFLKPISGTFTLKKKTNDKSKYKFSKDSFVVATILTENKAIGKLNSLENSEKDIVFDFLEKNQNAIWAFVGVSNLDGLLNIHPKAKYFYEKNQIVAYPFIKDLRDFVSSVNCTYLPKGTTGGGTGIYYGVLEGIPGVVPFNADAKRVLPNELIFETVEESNQILNSLINDLPFREEMITKIKNSVTDIDEEKIAKEYVENLKKIYEIGIKRIYK